MNTNKPDELRDKVIRILAKSQVECADQIIALFEKPTCSCKKPKISYRSIGDRCSFCVECGKDIAEKECKCPIDDTGSKVHENRCKFYKPQEQPKSERIKFKAEEWLMDLLKTNLSQDVKALLAYQQAVILELIDAHNRAKGE